MIGLLTLLTVLSSLSAYAADENGPTLYLQATPNPVADFMYFVPLISIEPVSSVTSPGSTQSMRMTSTSRHVGTHSFELMCEAQLTGDGWQRSTFDLTPVIREHESQLENGGSLLRMLKSIEVQGGGDITVEVEGALSNGIAIVREVRLRFNAHGSPSPVWIDLCDIHRVNGEALESNEILAQVNTITFRRRPGPPTMEVSVASVKHKEAGNGFWQNFKGRVAGVAANMLIDPLPVESAGHQAMLDFGLALVSDAPTFTFPRARNMQTQSAP
jgi:hypothetical protein